VRLRRHRRLSIGVYGHFLSRALLPRLDDLTSSLPSLEVDVHTSTNPLDLLPTRFDAVVAVSALGPQAGLVVRPLMPIVTVAVASPQRLQGGPLDFSRVPMLHTRPRSEDWRRWLDFAGLKTIAVRGGSSSKVPARPLRPLRPTSAPRSRSRVCCSPTSRTAGSPSRILRAGQQHGISRYNTKCA
jgi:LysR family glycine cleavage system transcriptional activator